MEAIAIYNKDATGNKGHRYERSKKLLVVPGHTSSNKKATRLEAIANWSSSPMTGQARSHGRVDRALQEQPERRSASGQLWVFRSTRGDRKVIRSWNRLGIAVNKSATGMGKKEPIEKPWSIDVYIWKFVAVSGMGKAFHRMTCWVRGLVQLQRTVKVPSGWVSFDLNLTISMVRGRNHFNLAKWKSVRLKHLSLAQAHSIPSCGLVGRTRHAIPKLGLKANLVCTAGGFPRSPRSPGSKRSVFGERHRQLLETKKTKGRRLGKTSLLLGWRPSLVETKGRNRPNAPQI